MQDLKENEIYSFCLAFKHSIDIIQDIKINANRDKDNEYDPGCKDRKSKVVA